MIKFGELDSNNKVINIVMGTDASISSLPGIFVKVDLINNPQRGDAHIGGEYDSNKDKFIAPKPYPSWTLNEETLEWNAPSQKPNDGKLYFWDEPSLTWIELVEVEIPLIGTNPVEVE